MVGKKGRTGGMEKERRNGGIARPSGSFVESPRYLSCSSRALISLRNRQKLSPDASSQPRTLHFDVSAS